MHLLNEIRHAFRRQVEHPRFALLVILTLALGIGPNVAIFSVVNAVLLSALPYRDPQQLVVLLEHHEKTGSMAVAYPNFLDWRRMSKSFEDMVCYRPQSSIIVTASGADRVPSKRVSHGFFHTIGVPMQLGRELLPEEDAVGGPPALVVSHSAWQRYLNGDTNAVGRTLNIEGVSHTVVGVAPAGFRFKGEAELFLPIHPLAHLEPRYARDNLYVVGRMKPGVSAQQAAAEMRLVAQQLEKEYPKENAGETIDFIPLPKWLAGNLDQVSVVLLCSVSLILLLACVNVAGLFLARLVERRREFAIRVAVGAGRSHLVGQTLIESFVLALQGGALGLLLAYPLRFTLTMFVAPEQLAAVKTDWRVVGYTLVLSSLAAIAFGLFPALRAVREDLNEPLRDRDSGGAAGQHRVQDMLVVSQIALALVLLTGAGLMLRTVSTLLAVNAGIRPEGVVTMEIQGPEDRFMRESQTPNGIAMDKMVGLWTSYQKELLERVQRLPAARSVAMAFPLVFGDCTAELGLLPDGATGKSDARVCLRYSVSPDYFRTMGISVLKGRVFTMRDDWKQPKVAILNETAARLLSPGRDPVGRSFVVDFEGYGSCTVVGVVADTLHDRLDAPPPPQVYLSFLQWPSQIILAVRTDLAPEAMGMAVRREVARFDQGAAVHGVRAMKDHVSDASVQVRQMSRVLAVLAGLALVLAGMGIYAVMTQTVLRRRHEIGVRLALGATSLSVLGMVLRKAMLLAAGGAAAGVVVAFLFVRVLKQWLVGVNLGDPRSYLGAATVLALVALGAAYWPARRAAATDPMVVLRSE